MHCIFRTVKMTIIPKFSLESFRFLYCVRFFFVFILSCYHISPPSVLLSMRNPHTHTHTHIHIHRHTYIYTHTHTYIHTHTHIHTPKHTHSHTHTQTYTHLPCRFCGWSDCFANQMQLFYLCLAFTTRFHSKMSPNVTIVIRVFITPIKDMISSKSWYNFNNRI